MDFTSLSFTDVSRNFGRRRALSRVSLRCDAGGEHRRLVCRVGRDRVVVEPLHALDRAHLREMVGGVTEEDVLLRRG